MRKIRDGLECLFTKERSNRETARYTGVSRETVADYRHRFENAKLPWPLPGEIDDELLELALYPVKATLGPSYN